MSITDNLTVVGAWIGKGELNIPEANGEELHALAPNRIESGFRYSLSYSVSDLRILEDHGLASDLNIPLPLRRSVQSLASPRGSPRHPRPAETLGGEMFFRKVRKLWANCI